MIVIPASASIVVPNACFVVPGWLVDHAQQLAQLTGETRSQWAPQYSRWSSVKHGRMSARFGDPGVTYTYNGSVKALSPLSPTLVRLRNAIDDLLSWRANCVYLNSYANGVGIYPHTDSTYIPELGTAPTIVSVSFGASRTFQLFPQDPTTKRRVRGSTPYSVVLNAGDLCVMWGDCDALYKHGMPDEPSVAGERVSLTFRRHT